jgi:hypothetical protein
MKRSGWLLVAAGALVLFCCAGSGLLMAVGAAAGGSAGSPGGNTGLEGSWLNGSASTTSYRSLVTGDFAPPSGTGMLYEFKGDGTCTQAAMLQSTVYSCTSWIFTSTDDCTWTLDGTTLTLELGVGVNRARMCGGEVKESESTARTQRYQVALGSDLTLTTDDGVAFRFQRSQ